MQDILIRLGGSLFIIGVVGLLYEILRTLHNFNERLEDLEKWNYAIKSWIQDFNRQRRADKHDKENKQC